MQNTRLGRSGAIVSRICLGTMNFGPVIDAEASFAIMDRAVEAGITFFDSADVYGGGVWGPNPGQSEAIVGDWLAARGPAARDAIVLATKVNGVMGEGPNDRGLSALHIRRAVEASLRRLRVEHIDLYQMHHVSRTVPVDEILDAFTLLHQQGKIGYLGSSNFAGWNLAQYRELAAATGRAPIVTEQSVYNLSNRAIELEVIPAARNYDIGILPWSPLAGGLLGGILAKGTRVRSEAALERIGDKLGQVQAYERFAAAIGVDPAQLALAWLLHQPAVTAPIVGPRSLEQLEGAIAAERITLDADTLAELDRLWPGPGGEAPEAYAW